MTPPAKPILDVQGLTVVCRAVPIGPNAVENVSFAVGPGEIVCVVGEIRLRQIRHRARHHGGCLPRAS